MISSSGQTTSLKCFNLYVYFLCMDALPAYMSMCSACWGQKWALDHWKWSYNGFELPCRHWELNYGLLEEQSVFFINERFSTPSASFWITYSMKPRQASIRNNLANWKSTWLELYTVLSLKMHQEWSTYNQFTPFTNPLIMPTYLNHIPEHIWEL